MKKKKWLSYILACCIILVPFNNVIASTNEPTTISGVSMKKNMTFFYYGKSSDSHMSGYGNTYTLISNKLSGNIKDIKAVSDNKKVVSIKKINNSKELSIIQIDVRLRKPGTARIYVTGIVNGKKVTDTAKIKVVKYKNPVVSLKLNNKDYASKFKRATGTYIIKKSAEKYKFSCKVTSDWKISKINTKKIYKSGDVSGCEYSSIKNNSCFRLKKRQTLEIIIKLYNKKLSITENIRIILK